MEGGVEVLIDEGTGEGRELREVVFTVATVYPPKIQFKRVTPKNILL